MGIYFTEIDRRAMSKGRLIARKWLHRVAEVEKYLIGDVVIAFCSDSYIVAANKKFLQHDYPTDIITFDESTDEERKNRLIMADLLISVDRVAENAQGYNVTTDEELHRVIVHGLLHLMGYDDSTPELQEKMRARENFHLKQHALIK